jgi:ribosomal protein L35
MAKKIKQKKHSGIAKTMKVRPGGTVKIAKVGVLHNTGKKSSKQSRQKRKGSELHKTDLKRIKHKI